jgi:nucleoid DNA-binding protein
VDWREVLKRVKDETGDPIAVARLGRLVRSLIEVVIAEATREGVQMVPGLGALVVKRTKPRRTLHEGVWYDVPSRRKLSLRPVKAAREAVNAGG